MKRDKKKQVIEVIFENYLKQFLQKTGLLDDFVNGKIKCIFCNNSVNFSNLSLIFIKEGNPVFVCDAQGCLEKVRDLLKKEVRNND